MERRHGSSYDDDQGAPESWELADLDESMRRLLVSSKVAAVTQTQEPDCPPDTSTGAPAIPPPAASENGSSLLAERINQVDQFLREALQNPRERLSVLRMEQDVEKFIQNPRQQQLEFPQFPTSYLRLAAHRVAQHYCLQSMVVVDNNSLDGAGSKIIVRKTSESRYPSIRLADIPVDLPQDEKNNVKVAIKQRPKKGSQTIGSVNTHTSKLNNAKSVEERKEEYNKARARIFSISGSGNLGGKSSEDDSAALDNWQCCSLATLKHEERPNVDDLRNNHTKGSADCSSGIVRINKSKVEREHIVKVKTSNSRVAIFRDRETDRKDPDYDRSYDRYTQRFDPGFGFNMGPYSMQAIYAPAVNYNTEFPQLSAPHRGQIHMEPPPRPIPQHVRAPWVASPSTMGYGPPDAMMGPFNASHMGAPSASAMYLHSSQFACPGPAMTYVHPHERIQQPLSHPSLQQQPEASFGQARPR